jgi:hypothetical protein
MPNSDGEGCLEGGIALTRELRDPTGVFSHVAPALELRRIVCVAILMLTDPTSEDVADTREPQAD